MFDPSAPRLFYEPPGVDFTTALHRGLTTRLRAHPPEAMARVTLLVNTTRMQRRVQSVFRDAGTSFLPRIHMVSDPSALVPTAPLPTPAPPLRLQLDLAQLVTRLLEASPELAPRSAALDLARSLQDVLAEMQEEEVPASALETIETQGLSVHWERSLTFLRIVSDYLSLDDANPRLVTKEARDAAALTALAARWAETPPADPVIVAGSTGSRGPTLRLMQLVTRLPQGALILPGFDDLTPPAIWDAMGQPKAEDHPQYRYHALLATLNRNPGDLQRWSDLPCAAPARNALISLAMRPAPVTDQWRREGPKLPDITTATRGLALVEADTTRAEALTIALRLRAAVEDGQSAALISPDRVLTRQVTAALDRWGIEPDDSAGTPLGLSAVGRLMRMTAKLRGQALTGEDLLALLKHPLAQTGSDIRGNHLRHTRDLELEALRGAMAFPDGIALRAWATAREDRRLDRGLDPDQSLAPWIEWLAPLVDAFLVPVTTLSLRAHLSDLGDLLSRLVNATDNSLDPLWQGRDGEAARGAMEALAEAATGDTTLTASDFAILVKDSLTDDVRDPVRPHPGVMIWGPMEARIQATDLVILAGLNDGVWPNLPNPDPWLNRQMRASVGLRAPERRVGLSAHDFQQGIAGTEVWLTRATRDAETETIPSRWLNRITNLLDGLGGEAKAALKRMRQDGETWRAKAATLDRPSAEMAKATRPAPAPPLSARPRQLSVTEIQTQIRDPFAIYAKHVLSLRALDPLRQTPDARLRGSVLHDVLETFIKAYPDDLPPDATTAMERVLDDVLLAQSPWPANRRLWRAKLMRTVPWFLDTEAQRRNAGRPLVIEEKGGMMFDLPGGPFRLSAKADRIDLRGDGTVEVFDYKTGKAPSDKVQRIFDKQLLLEALIIADGGFASLGPRHVAAATYLSLAGKGEATSVPIDADTLSEVAARLKSGLGYYDNPAHGYTSRQAMQMIQYSYDFDHLARLGEWDETQMPVPQKVGT